MNPVYDFLKRAFKRSIHALDWDLIRYNVNTSDDLALQKIIQFHDIRTVIDGGANIGQYSQGLVDGGFKGKIFSFEPIPSVFKELEKKSSKFSQWKAFNLGLGSKEDESFINVSENFVSSSILQVAKQSLDAEPQTRTTHREKIRITTIDNFFAGEYKLDKETLLKLDVQGYEMEALRGALTILPEVLIIQAELSFVPLYENGPLFHDMVSFLEKHGFEVYSIIPGFKDVNTGRLLQADGIFVRK
jgi:FkbM family methyltransferase